MERKIKLVNVLHEEFGYCITKCMPWEDEEFVLTMTDMQWITFLGIPKDFYIDTLINEYNAYQNASREFPRLFFKQKEDAEKALKDFYEPLIVAMTLYKNYNL